jgi:uncharacterized protein (DUF1778 family)
MPYCQCECTDLKELRLQIRIDSAAKRRLELAAAAARQTVSSFVLQAAQQRADEVLADRAVIQLSQAAPETFVEALERPASVNERLNQTLRSPKKKKNKKKKKFTKLD